MTKDQEKLYELYMKMSKKTLAEMLAIINTSNGHYPSSTPTQPGLLPPYPPYECPPWRPQEIWYTSKTADVVPRFENNIN